MRGWSANEKERNVPKKTGKDLRAEMVKEKAGEKKEYGGYDKWEVESWASTLKSAADILSDPKKMKAVSKCLCNQERSMATLKELTSGAMGKGKSSQQDPDD